MNSAASTVLTARFREALLFAAQLHAAQTRKGSGVPYIAHLLGVTSIVLEHGGSEDQAIAALLHDAVEDQGGAAMRARIHDLFGGQVAEIVDACSDSDSFPKPPWRERKEAYLRRLRDESEAASLVSLADKLHNARSIVADVHRQGESVWARFTGGKKGTLWYYNALVEVFRQRNGSNRDIAALVGELEKTVTEMNRLAVEIPE